MKKNLTYLFLLIALNGLLWANSTYAEESMPLPARVFVTGAAGSAPGFSGDVLVPLYGNYQEILYTNLQAKYVQDDNSWFSGLGVGYRKILNDRQLLGSYLFVDRSVASSEKNYWSLNLGLEGVYQQWDWHTNGYVPISKQSYQLERQFASQQGDYSYVNFTGHEQYDRVYVNTETISSGGVDAEVGYRIRQANQLRLALGGYYFNLKNNQMRGVIGTIEYPLNSRFSVLAQNSYDNVQGNTCLLSLRMRFGGVDTQDLQQRLLDPVQRNLSTLGTGTSMPVTQRWVDQGQALEQNHIWFFKPGGENYQVNAGLNNCTIEHPCGDSNLTQANIDAIHAIDPDTHFYLTQGVYLLDPGITGTDRISLYQGQTIDGRSNDYKLPVADDQKPLLIGGLDLNGDNIISNIALNSSYGDGFLNNAQVKNLNISLRPTPHIGMQIHGARNQLRNVIIGRPPINRNENVPSNDYSIGIMMFDNSNLTFTDRSGVYAAGRTNSTIGISVGDNASLLVENDSEIVAQANSSATTSSNMQATGVILGNNSRGIIQGSSRVTAIAEYNRANPFLLPGRAASAVGISIVGNPLNRNSSSRLIVFNSSINARATTNLENSFASAIGIVNPGHNRGELTINNNFFNINAEASRAGTNRRFITTIGIQNLSNVPMEQTNNTFRSQGQIIPVRDRNS